MRIAFDLDNTLIRCGASFATEAPTVWPFRWLVHDELRAGTTALLRALRRRDADVWVYTTSHRSVLAVKLLLLAYGISLGGVVNQACRHRRNRAPESPTSPRSGPG